MNFFLVSLLLASKAFAQAPECTPTNALTPLKTLNQHSVWWAASDQQISDSPCWRKKPFTNGEMISWLNAHASKKKKKSENIFGINLINEDPRLVEALKDLLTNQDFFGAADPKDQKKFKSSCTSAICAAQEIFGKREGVQLLFMHERFGYNASPYQSQAAAWKANELDDALLGLSAFPETSLPITSNRRFVHFLRGYMRADDTDGTVIANSSVEIFDTWNDLPPPSRKSTIVHEIGHNFADVMGADESPTWLAFSGWVKKTNPKTSEDQWKSSKPSTLISEYGKTNPAEDFAECVVAYRFNPLKLQKTSPEKYAFLKATIFNGAEYTSSSTCEGKNSLQNQAKARMIAFSKNPQSLAQSPELKIAEKQCAEKAFHSIASKIPLSKNSAYHDCMQKSFSSAVCSQLTSLDRKNPYSGFSAKLLQSQHSGCVTVPDAFTDFCVFQANQNLKEALLSGIKTTRDESSNQDNCNYWQELTGTYPENSIYGKKSDPKSLRARYDLINCNSNYSIDRDLMDLSKAICSKIKSDRSKIGNWIDSKFSDDELKSAVNAFVPYQ